MSFGTPLRSAPCFVFRRPETDGPTENEAPFAVEANAEIEALRFSRPRNGAGGSENLNVPFFPTRDANSRALPYGSKSMDPLTTIVLAGGASSRMGRPKALLPFGAETLIERAVRRMAAVSLEVVVVSGPHLKLPALPATARVVEDENPLQGPLAGLLYGLRAARTDLCFACGCDLPFLRPEIARFLAGRSAGADGAMPEWDGFPQPLLAAYHKRLSGLLADLITAGERRAVSILEHAKITLVPSAELRSIDPDGVSFIDVDTPEAYQNSLQRLAAGVE